MLICVMKILGISRDPKYSPNATDRDAAIFQATASRLARHHHVSLISEEFFISVDLEEFDAVFSMARSHSVLTALAEAESTMGLQVFNAAHALLAATRVKQAEVFQEKGVPQPAFAVCQSLDANLPALPFPFWLKRSDACAQHTGDVRFIGDEQAWAEAVTDFSARAVSEALALEHVQGDVVKFYGVEGTSFFYASVVSATTGYSKFGLERHNGEPHHYAYNAEALRQAANVAARALGLTIYGGDAIVSPDGHFYIIDFNDWPSFAACRKVAAKAIAERIESAFPVVR